MDAKKYWIVATLGLGALTIFALVNLPQLLTSIPYWIQNWEMMMQAYPGSAWVVPMILMGLVMYALTIVSFILLVFKKKIAYYIAMAAVILFIITFLLNMITQQVFNPVVTFIIVLLIIEALFIHKSKPLLK